MPPEKMTKCDGNHGGPPCADPECWAREERPHRIVLLPDEVAYLERLIAADLHRMIEARDHGVSHGMRGYSPPDLERATRIGFSLSMARTAAAIDAIEDMESSRQDLQDAERERQTPEA